MSNQLENDAKRIAQQLHSGAIHLGRNLRRADRESGLNPARLSALSVVVFAGRITLGALAEAEQVRRPTMTRIVAALESDGLVVRHPNPEDGRSAFLTATTAGKRLLVRSRNRRVQSLARRIELLPAWQRQRLHEAASILAGLLG